VVQSSVDLVGSFGSKYDLSVPLSPAITTNSTKICTANFTGTLFVRKTSSGKTYNTVLQYHKISYIKNRFFRKDCSKSKFRIHGMCWGGWSRAWGTVYICAEATSGEKKVFRCRKNLIQVLLLRYGSPHASPEVLHRPRSRALYILISGTYSKFAR